MEVTSQNLLDLVDAFPPDVGQKVLELLDQGPVHPGTRTRTSYLWNQNQLLTLFGPELERRAEPMLVKPNPELVLPGLVGPEPVLC